MKTKRTKKGLVALCMMLFAVPFTVSAAEELETEPVNVISDEVPFTASAAEELPDVPFRNYPGARTTIQKQVRLRLQEMYQLVHGFLFLPVSIALI